jgi:hypothetical protein
MSTPIETLKKIEFSTIEQFLEDINRNFAVVENSPLYKGIPGNPGGPGGPGLSGVRGVKFLFVKLSNFQTQFPGELSAGSQIDLNYINTKLIDFDNKQKLLLALEITEFVDKDIIVLTNTIMLSFDYIDNIFINTGIAFNEQSNLLNNIQTQIENYVQYYISHNQTINNLTNIFEGYITYAKNYADTNNVFITSSLTQSSVFSPFIPGYNSNIGILMNNHKYFGFSDEQFPKNNNGTIVFGAMKKYYDLLMSTISTDQNQTLTSDYAPGVDNIPAAVFLQDTEKAGLLIGYKGRPNLKRFANIYKNDLHELILKSDSGVNPSEFSLLKIHKDYLKFDKLVQFGNDLEVSRDTKLFSDIYNGFIKTGKFTTGASSLNGFNQDIIEIGKPGFNTQNRQSIVKNVADIETYKYYLNNVLITNSNGQVSKSYSLETTLLSNTNITDLNLISESINSGNKILTSYYFGYLARKINAVSTFVTNNYWKKNQFNTGVIPHLWIGGNLRIGENISLSDDMIITNTEDRIIYFDVLETYLKSQIINFENFKNKVLITDNTGNLLSNYSLETNILNPAELVTGQQLTIFNELDTNILSTKYYAHLAKKINNIDSIVSNGVWNKTQYNTFEIPNLYLSNDLIVKGNVIFKPNNLEVFKVNATTNEVTIGNSITATNLNSNIIKLQNYINKVLITGSNGEILNTWIVEPANHNNSELSENILLSDNIGTSQTTIAKGSHIKFINKKINQVILWVTNKFWSRLQFASGIIPSLWLSDWLRVDNKFTAGNINNPNIYSEGNNTNLGKTGGDTIIKGQNIKIENKPNNVLVTDANSNILDQYSIETLLPNSGPGTGGQADNEIVADFWIKPLPTDTLPWQPFLNIAFSPFKFLTSIHFEHLIKHIKAIRTLLYDRPTFDEMQDMIDKGMPIGGIILYDLILGPVPDNFVVCDGRIIPGTNLYTRNYIDKFVKGSLTPAIIGGNVGNMQTLQLNNMVPHVHTIAPHTHEC